MAHAKYNRRSEYVLPGPKTVFSFRATKKFLAHTHHNHRSEGVFEEPLF